MSAKPISGGDLWSRLSTVAATRGYRNARIFREWDDLGLYQADKDAGTPVLIRCLSDDEAADPAARREFMDAAGLAARINHPMMLELRDVLDLGDRQALVLEHVDGRKLSQIVDLLAARRQRLRPEAAATLALRVTEALEFAHHSPGGEPVVHRGLCPSGVVLSRAGFVKLVDGAFTTVSRAQKIADQREIPSAPNYQAPERFGHYGQIDQRCDVYAVGALLYELVTTAQPFRGATPRELGERLSRGIRPDTPSQLNRRLCPRLEQIIQRAMTPDPALRTPHLQELQQELTAWLELQPGKVMGAQRLAAVLAALYPPGGTARAANSDALLRAVQNASSPRIYRVAAPPANTGKD